MRILADCYATVYMTTIFYCISVTMLMLPCSYLGNDATPE